MQLHGPQLKDPTLLFHTLFRSAGLGAVADDAWRRSGIATDGWELQLGAIAALSAGEFSFFLRE